MPGAGCGTDGADVMELHRESSAAVGNVGEDVIRDSPDKDAGDRKSEGGTDAG